MIQWHSDSNDCKRHLAVCSTHKKAVIHYVIHVRRKGLLPLFPHARLFLPPVMRQDPPGNIRLTPHASITAMAHPYSPYIGRAALAPYPQPQPFPMTLGVGVRGVLDEGLTKKIKLDDIRCVIQRETSQWWQLTGRPSLSGVATAYPPLFPIRREGGSRNQAQSKPFFQDLQSHAEPSWQMVGGLCGSSSPPRDSAALAWTTYAQASQAW